MRTRGGAGGGGVGAGEWVTAAGTAAEGVAGAAAEGVAGNAAEDVAGAAGSGAGAPPHPASAQDAASALAAASACLTMVTDMSGSRVSALADANMKRRRQSGPAGVN
jgi:hypothetical protein